MRARVQQLQWLAGVVSPVCECAVPHLLDALPPAASCSAAECSMAISAAAGITAGGDSIADAAKAAAAAAITAWCAHLANSCCRAVHTVLVLWCPSLLPVGLPVAEALTVCRPVHVVPAAALRLC